MANNNNGMDRLIEEALREGRVPVRPGHESYVLAYLSSIGSEIIANPRTRRKYFSPRDVFHDYLDPLMTFCKKYVDEGSRVEVLGLIDERCKGHPGRVRRLAMELTQKSERERALLDAAAVRGFLERSAEIGRPRGLVHSA